MDNSSELMFGDFDDLDSDDYRKVQEILFHTKRSSHSAIQFPWPANEPILYGNTFGQEQQEANRIVDTGHQYPIPDNSGQTHAVQEHSAIQHVIIRNQTVNASEQLQQTQNVVVPASAPTQNVMENLGEKQKSSRLYENLKIGERRNKKKRPPGYYSNNVAVPNLGAPEHQPQMYMDRVVQPQTQQISQHMPYPPHTDTLVSNDQLVTGALPHMRQMLPHPTQTYNPPGVRTGPPFRMNNATVAQTQFQNMSISNQIYHDGSRTDNFMPQMQSVPPGMRPGANMNYPITHTQLANAGYLNQTIAAQILVGHPGIMNTGQPTIPYPPPGGHPAINVNTIVQLQPQHLPPLQQQEPQQLSPNVNRMETNHISPQIRTENDNTQIAFGSVDLENIKAEIDSQKLAVQKSSEDDKNMKITPNSEPSSSPQAVKPVTVTQPPVHKGGINQSARTQSKVGNELQREQKSNKNATTTTEVQKLDPVESVPRNNEKPAPQVQSNTSKSSPKTWAGLFKPSSSNAPVVNESGGDSNKHQSQENPSTNVSSRSPSEAGDDKVSVTSEGTQVTVTAAEDKSAKDVGVIALSHKVNHRPVSLQPRGLTNRGNWCYVNATLQALLACPPFYHLIKSMPNFPVLRRGPSSTPVLDSLVWFFNEFSPMNYKPIEKMEKLSGKGKVQIEDIQPGSTFEPMIVYKMLQDMKSDAVFKHGKQEDAEEFLSCVLNGVHDEMVAAMDLVTGKSKQNNSVTPNGISHDEEQVIETEEEEEGGWEQVGPKNKSVITRAANIPKSPISEIFGGQMRSILHQHGAKESATLQPFFTLQLDIQSDRVMNVKDALEGLVSKESLQGFTCSRTKKEVEATRKSAVETLPPVLVLHLKYFVYDKNGGCQKMPKKIDFDVDLEIQKDLLSQNVRSKYQPNQRMYKLFAVLHHHGAKAIGGGHYTTDVYHPGIKGWIRTDDNIVKVVPVHQVLKFNPPKVPYLLYYRRTDLQ